MLMASKLVAALAAAVLALVLGAADAQAEDRTGDRAAIAEMLYCYAYAVDTLGNSRPTAPDRDPGLADATARFKRCLAEDAQLQLFFNGPKGTPTQAGSGGPIEFARFVRQYFTASRTQHIVGNVVVVTGADAASVTSYIQANHWLGDGRLLIVPVRYEDRAVRVGGEWKIAHRDIIAMRFWVAEGYVPPNPVDPTLARLPGSLVRCGCSFVSAAKRQGTRTWRHGRALHWAGAEQRDRERQPDVQGSSAPPADNCKPSCEPDPVPGDRQDALPGCTLGVDRGLRLEMQRRVARPCAPVRATSPPESCASSAPGEP